MSENTKQKEKLVKDLDNHISKIKDALISMKDSVNEIQEGNGKKPYWNGSNAYSVLKNSLIQYENDMDLLNTIVECRDNIKI